MNPLHYITRPSSNLPLDDYMLRIIIVYAIYANFHATKDAT